MTRVLRPWQLVFAGAFAAVFAAVLAALAPPVGAASPKAPAATFEPKADRATAPTASDVRRTVLPRTPAVARSGATADRAVVRLPDQSAEQLATRALPPGADTITKPLELDLPPLGKVILVLYEVASDDPAIVNDPSVYRGLVLVPDGRPGAYRIERLPSQKEGAGTLMYDVLSVFAADADGDGAPELCILSEITAAGAGDRGKSHTDTDLFRWSGSAFTLVDQGDKRPLYNLRCAKDVRTRLKKRRGR